MTPGEDWVDVDEELAAETRERLGRLGYTGDLHDAFLLWAGTENLEERVSGVERLDPVVLEHLRSARLWLLPRAPGSTGSTRIPVEENLGGGSDPRERLRIRAFGMNAYTAVKVGDIVVEEHNEGSGHEEVYVVISGLARFTIDGDDFEAPAGTIVYLPNPHVVRSHSRRRQHHGARRGAAGRQGVRALGLGVALRSGAAV